MKKNNDCIDFNKSATVGECENTPTAAPIAPAGEAILLANVDLGVITVNTNLVANIHFPDPVLEIKDIKKRVKIVQCRLLLPGVATPGTFSDDPRQLFLRGFVRKNIQYATPCPGATDSCVSSELRSLTVDIPFECVTTFTPIRDIELPTLNTRGEFDFFRAQPLGPGFPEKDELLSSDLSQFHQESTAFYNRLPFCELIRHNITEWDEAVDRQPLPNHGPFEEGTFQNIVEKMFLNFTIKVLQPQQVRVNAL